MVAKAYVAISFVCGKCNERAERQGGSSSSSDYRALIFQSHRLQSTSRRHGHFKLQSGPQGSAARRWLACRCCCAMAAASAASASAVAAAAAAAAAAARVMTPLFLYN